MQYVQHRTASRPDVARRADAIKDDATAQQQGGAKGDGTYSGVVSGLMPEPPAADKADGEGAGTDATTTPESNEKEAKGQEAEGEEQASPEGEVAGSIAEVGGPPATRSMGDVVRSDGEGEQTTGSPSASKGDENDTRQAVTKVTIKPSFSFAGSSTGGASVNPFGSESINLSFSGASYSTKDNTLTLTGTLNCDCTYGVNGGGNIDVPAATAAVVKADTWEKIRDDLMPSTASPHKSPRDEYWSKALTERHEAYHATDDIQWTKSSGMALLKAFFNGKEILKSEAATKLPGLLETIRKKILKKSFEYYYGGASDPGHSNRAGEKRAYGDGKPHYQKLAQEVEKHGKLLAAKAKQEKGDGKEN